MEKQIQGEIGKTEITQFSRDFILEMIILWYLQQKGFFDDNTNYFPDLFGSYHTTTDHNSFYETLLALRQTMATAENRYVSSTNFGKLRATGPVIILMDSDVACRIGIHDDFFSSAVHTEVTLFNFLETLEWEDGKMDTYALGSLFEQLIEGEKRKSTGAYYTPRRISSFISGIAIDEHICSGSSQREDTLYCIEKASVDQLLDIFQKLSKTTLLDPAMGSGHFLDSAVDYILDVIRRINTRLDELEVENKDLFSLPTKRQQTNHDTNSYLLHYLSHQIIPHMIFGVDSNKIAVQIAKLRLFLKVVHYDQMNSIVLPQLRFNLSHGNSLLGYCRAPNSHQELSKVMLDEKLSLTTRDTKYLKQSLCFHWIVEFPEVMQGEKFSIVLGNPPYGSFTSRAIIELYHPLTSGRINIAELFWYRQMELLGVGGIVALVLPKPFLHKENYFYFRKTAVDYHKILALVDLKMAFKGVGSEQMIIFAKKTSSTIPAIDEVKKWDMQLGTKEENLISSFDIDNAYRFQSYNEDLEKNEHGGIYYANRFIVRSNPILESILARLKLLADENRITMADSIYRGGRGKSKKSKSNNDPILGRKDFCRFIVGEPSRIGEGNEEEKVEKIIIARSISSKPHVVAAYDTKGHYLDEGIYRLIPLMSQEPEQHKLVTAILNSRFVAYFCYSLLFNQSVLTMDIDRFERYLPVPGVSDQIMEEISELVDNYSMKKCPTKVSYLFPELDDLIHRIFGFSHYEIREIKEATVYLDS